MSRLDGERSLRELVVAGNGDSGLRRAVIDSWRLAVSAEASGWDTCRLVDAVTVFLAAASLKQPDRFDLEEFERCFWTARKALNRALETE